MNNVIKSAHTYKLSDDGTKPVVGLTIRGGDLTAAESELLLREAQAAVLGALAMIEAGREAPKTERNPMGDPDAIRAAFKQLGAALEREIGTVAA